ncbi:MAG: DNA-binding protein [Deltaproteobacteria bacterium]|nr:DNA-binding protein [Candidatus Anaeroferrophillus wilburensis]MBN2887778.1 DNA-binding protein [Deltaproteobacteria bacterium]
MKLKNMIKLFLVVGLLLAVPIHAWSFPGKKQGAGQSVQQVGQAICGKVLETMDSGGYTYVLLDTGAEELWVATPPMAVEVGQQVALVQGIEMADFTSNTLKRTFAKIIFSGGLLTEAPQGTMASCEQKKCSKDGSCPLPSGKPMMNGPHGDQQESSMAADVNVEKAAGENGYTIGELFAQKGTLEGQKVVVRGKVVKINENIMQRNWIHLQDGSGDPAKGSHDLAVTSSALPEVGQVVTVSGVFHGDKDFPAGYHFEAIVEEATVQ